MYYLDIGCCEVPVSLARIQVEAEVDLLSALQVRERDYLFEFVLIERRHPCGW